MERNYKKGRVNQRRRTRKDILEAAGRLLRQGRSPTIEEVADEAQVSRATAYRYFPSVQGLLVEAPIDGEVPDPETLFAEDPAGDPEARVDKAEAALHEMVYRNESQLRLLLSHSLGTERGADSENAVPVRQNRRIPLIEAALAPVRGRFSDSVYKRLCAALALVFGPESMIVFRDVVPLDPHVAREVKRWTIGALVRAALDESAGRGKV